MLALSADATAPAAIARYLGARGFGQSSLHVLEALGGPRERIRSTLAENFGFNDVEALNLIAIEVEASPGAKIIPLSTGLPDEMFEHDGQITKREIRAVTLPRSRRVAGELLWDIGCGSGSVAIEWLLRHPSTRAIGIERDPLRAARAARNAAELGVPGLEVVTGEALSALAALPSPDAIFIGGGGRTGVIDKAFAALKPAAASSPMPSRWTPRGGARRAAGKFGGALTRLAVERADAVGGKQAFRPAMTVTQWSAVKDHDRAFHRRRAGRAGPAHGPRRELIARCPVCLYAGSLVRTRSSRYCPEARASSTRRR